MQAPVQSHAVPAVISCGPFKRKSAAWDVCPYIANNRLLVDFRLEVLENTVVDHLVGWRAGFESVLEIVCFDGVTSKTSGGGEEIAVFVCLGRFLVE